MMAGTSWTTISRRRLALMSTGCQSVPRWNYDFLTRHSETSWNDPVWKHLSASTTITAVVVARINLLRAGCFFARMPASASFLLPLLTGLAVPIIVTASDFIYEASVFERVSISKATFLLLRIFLYFAVFLGVANTACFISGVIAKATSEV